MRSILNKLPKVPLQGGTDPKIHMENLLSFYGALRSRGCNPLVGFGTLLGLLREGHPISGDHDVDLLLEERDEGTLIRYIVEEQQKNKLSLARAERDLLTVVINDQRIDIYIFRPLWSGVLSCWSFYFMYDYEFSMPSIISEFQAPSSPELYLCDHYDDWRVPSIQHAKYQRTSMLASMQSSYWNYVYSESVTARTPSQFALFCIQEKLIKENDCIADVGRGNMRDSTYFAKNGAKVTAIDASRTPVPPPGVKFLSKLACEMNYNPYGVIYARWFLHAAPPAFADRFLMAASQTKPGTKLLLEFRTESPNDGHKRWPIKKEEAMRRLRVHSFDILHEEEGRGLSKVSEDDPLLARIIAQRSSTA